MSATTSSSTSAPERGGSPPPLRTFRIGACLLSSLKSRPPLHTSLHRHPRRDARLTSPPATSQEQVRDRTDARGQYYVLLLLVILGTVLVSPAQARPSLSKSAAARVARIELSEYADHRCNLRSYCDYAAYPELTKYDCKQLSARTVRCHGGVDLSMDSDDYITGFDYCEADVLVKLGRNPRISGWSCLGY